MMERAEAERVKAEAEQAKERKRNEIRRRLPKVPEASDTRKVARLRFRVPARGSTEENDDGASGGIPYLTCAALNSSLERSYSDSLIKHFQNEVQFPLN
jgi:hypothetical protein